MSDDSTLPVNVPDPLVVAQWASVGRHALTYGGGFLSAFGLSMPSWLGSLTDPQLNMIFSGVLFFGGLAMTLVGVIKGRWDKWRARRNEVAAARASAEMSAKEGRPVAVTVNVTPDGVPNEAVRVSKAEQRGAPSVPIDVTPRPAPRAA